MDDFELYLYRQRQFERNKLLPRVEEQNTQPVNMPVAVPVQKLSSMPENTDGLFGEYQDLGVLMMALEETDAKRKRAKKSGSQDIENELALRKFKPVMQAWISAKVILDRKFFALVVYFAVGSGDYPLLIEMCDLATELKFFDFEPTLSRQLPDFIVDEIWKLCVRDYWHQPDGPRTKKRLRKPMPDWFWVIFERIVVTEKWPTVGVGFADKLKYKQNELLQIAGYDALYKGEKQKAVDFWSKCQDLSSRSGVVTALKELLAEMHNPASS